ncbi:MAG: amino acid ABC transporter ATP-binding protein [Planctomycetota bacterium]|nr:MAG: amino acid ABC transporter ATP-binding protein [Planctomycetota bacterium]
MSDAGATPVIQVRALEKRFGEHVILDDVSLDVSRGEVCGILGPSGGGKTTFLRCLNGLENFQAGEILVAGETLRPGTPAGERERQLLRVRRRVGMVFQQFNLFPHRSALDNVIEAPVHVLGTPRAAAIEQAEALLARVGLADKFDHMPDMLSGGQQQRVAIARALAMQPEVLLFDEPTSALDPRMAAEVEAVIAEVAATGQTMVVVTHSLRLARRTAGTLHIFDASRIVESGPTEQVFDSPRTESTRRFLDEAYQK